MRPERVGKARSLEKEADIQEQKEAFQAARRARAEVVELYTKAFGTKHFAVNRARLALAHNELLARLSPEQRQQLEEAARLYQQGNNLTAISKAAEGEKAHQQALKTRKQILGEEHQDTAASYFNLGNALFQQDQLTQAEDLERKGLAIRLKVLGEEDPDTAVNYEHLSLVLARQFKFTEAEKMDRKSLEINRKLMLEAYRNYQNRGILELLREMEFSFHGRLADSYRARGMYAQAELQRRKALALVAPFLPENHVTNMAGLMNLGNVLLDQGNYQDAYRCYEKALKICRSNPKKGVYDQSFGNDFIETDLAFQTSQVLNNLAVAKQLLREFEDAGNFSKQAIAQLQKVAAKETRHANARDSLMFNFQIVQAKGLDDAGQSEAALKINKKLLAELEPASDRHRQVWLRNYFLGIGQNLNSLGDFQTAEPILELQKISLKLNRPYDTDARANIDFLLARNFLCQGDYQKAEGAALAAAATFETARGQTSFSGLERSLFAADRSPLPLLAALSARNGKPVEAWKYFEKNLGRGLFEDLTARTARPLKVAERNEEEALLGRLALIERRLADLQGGNAKLLQERDQVLLQLRQWQAKMEEQYGPVAGKVYELSIRSRRARLPPHAALIAWLDIPGHPKAKDPQGEHWGVVVRHTGAPVWVKLIGSLDQTWRRRRR